MSDQQKEEKENKETKEKKREIQRGNSSIQIKIKGR